MTSISQREISTPAMTPGARPETAMPSMGTRARLVHPERVEKPWGHEVIFAATERFAGKLLEIRAGERLSLHFHREKHEMLYVLQGAVRLFVEEAVSGPAPAPMASYAIETGEAFELPPGTVHRIEAIRDALLVEASSPEVDDVVRLADDYGRAGG